MVTTRRSRAGSSALLTAALSLAGVVGAATLAGCGDDAAVCQGPELLPHLSPVSFGDLYPLRGSDEPDPSTREAVPYEWVLLLTADCAKTAKIEKVCVVGEGHNGDPTEPSFTIEGPVPDTLGKGDTAAVRITYDHDDVNVDLDDDGEPDQDDAALVIQSNATNFPTLVVPLCARVVKRGEERLATFPCDSPVSVPAGVADATLCP